ncbi:MAG TPA: hydroxymethylglutaryl-CoA reductase [Longimicrobiales bacterium]|nr:hydroxymethylglutaryl-CoA reductase [Longimicrobiales bacterium]
MPIPYQRAIEISRRLAGEDPVGKLHGILASDPGEKAPFAPPIPAQGAATTEATRERVSFLEERVGPLPHLTGRAAPPDPASLAGNIENHIGMASVPVGIVGPLRVNGLHARGDFYAPLATTEGALVASYARGSRLLTLAGGVSSIATVQHVQRAPGFKFGTLSEAIQFAAWAASSFDVLKAVAATRTRHGELLDLRLQFQANVVYLILDFHTGDAAGQNMVTLCTAAICEHIVTHTPVKPDYWVIESNMSGDKKATSLSFFETRGRHVTAEVTLPAELVESRLRTTPRQMADYWRMSFVGAAQTGSIGFSGHVANAIAALFIACGQDVACISESSVAMLRMEVTAEGDLYAGLTLPSLMVGSVGGGTRLPTAQECLRILGCQGEGGAARLAEITAALALAGEVSIAGAICSGEFAMAHASLGRPGQSGSATTNGQDDASRE